jgi:hypothetical protein
MRRAPRPRTSPVVPSFEKVAEYLRSRHIVPAPTIAEMDYAKNGSTYGVVCNGWFVRYYYGKGGPRLIHERTKTQPLSAVEAMTVADSWEIK